MKAQTTLISGKLNGHAIAAAAQLRVVGSKSDGSEPVKEAIEAANALTEGRAGILGKPGDQVQLGEQVGSQVKPGNQEAKDDRRPRIARRCEMLLEAGTACEMPSVFARKLDSGEWMAFCTGCAAKLIGAKELKKMGFKVSAEVKFPRLPAEALYAEELTAIADLLKRGELLEEPTAPALKTIDGGLKRKGAKDAKGEGSEGELEHPLSGFHAVVLPTEGEKKEVAESFFAMLGAQHKEKAAVAELARPALARICKVMQDRSGQPYKVRQLLYSLYNGQETSLLEIVGLDWPIRQDLCAVLLAFGFEEVTRPGCDRDTSRDFFYAAMREAIEKAGVWQWFIEAEITDEEGSGK